MEYPNYKYLLENFSDNVYEGVKYAQSFYGEYPKGNKKPFLNNKHTSEEAIKYANELNVYEKSNEYFKKQVRTYQDNAYMINQEIEKYIKELSGLFNHVPENKQSKVWAKAWEDGHSYGYSEVYGHLRNLVDLFTE